MSTTVLVSIGVGLVLGVLVAGALVVLLRRAIERVIAETMW